MAKRRYFVVYKSHTGRKIRDAAGNYFLYFGRSKFDAKVLNPLPEPLKTDIMNTFVDYYEKGVEEGIEKGKDDMKKEIVLNPLHSQ